MIIMILVFYLYSLFYLYSFILNFNDNNDPCILFCIFIKRKYSF